MAKEAQNGQTGPSEGGAEFELPPEIVKMARTYFDRADEASRRNNFGYAIAMYMDGLKFMPDDVERGHRPLYDTALRQKAAGKPKTGASTFARMKASVLQMTGKKREAFFELERAMTAAPEGHLDLALLAQIADGLDWGKTALFFARKAIDAGQRAAKLNESLCVQVANILEKRGQYREAMDALQEAEKLDKTNSGRHQKRIRDLAARTTLGQGVQDAESFRERIKDFQQARESETQKVITVEEDLVRRADKMVEDLEANPNDTNLMITIGDTYARAYKDDQAMKYYRKARAASGGADYRIKVKMDDLRMRQMRHNLRAVEEKLRETPDDAALKKQRDELLEKRNQFELELYAERAQEYPTDMGVRYELGLRQFRCGKGDEAIESLQLATRDPKRKVLALNLLGKCFFQRKMHQEASRQFQTAMDGHEISGDAIWKELRYNLGLTYEAMKQFDKAADCYSELVMTDFRYRDAAQRLQRVRSRAEADETGDVRMSDVD